MKQVVTQKPVVMEEAIKQVVPRGLRWWRRGRSRLSLKQDIKQVVTLRPEVKQVVTQK